MKIEGDTERLIKFMCMAALLRDYVVHSPSCRAGPQKEAMSSLCDCGLREIAIEHDKLRSEAL